MKHPTPGHNAARLPKQPAVANADVQRAAALERYEEMIKAELANPVGPWVIHGTAGAGRGDSAVASAPQAVAPPQP